MIDATVFRLRLVQWYQENLLLFLHYRVLTKPLFATLQAEQAKTRLGYKRYSFHIHLIENFLFRLGTQPV